jgi:hypothetical protein
VNANGISRKNDFAELHSLCVSLKAREVDAIAIQEVNTDFMQADIREAYTTIFKEHFGQARVLTATTCIQSPRAWKPGGVVLAILGPWAQHVSKVSCNDLGRWVSATLTGTDGDSFTLFSLYNVVDTTLQDSGPSTVLAQQYRLLRLGGVTHPNPRKQCVEDLQRVIARLVHNEEKVVAVGNFNEVLGHDPGLMASVCAANHLFDVHAKFHGEAANIPIYARGSKRLDYCAASASLEPYVAASRFNIFNECILHSDHIALFADFLLEAYFGHAPPTLVRPDLRFISTSSPEVSKFVWKMHSHLSENRAFHRYHEFCLDVNVVDEPWRLANQIDQVTGHAFATAEKHCSKTQKPPWSAKLHVASLKVRYWKTALTARRTRVQQTTVLRNLAAEIWLDKPQPTTPPSSTRILNNISTAAQQALRRIRRNAAKEREQFLTELKARLALRISSQTTDADVDIKNIERQLTNGRRFHRIRQAIKPTNGAALTKVEIKTSESHLHPQTGLVVTKTTTKVVDTQRALEQAIIERKKRHFAQAEGTPFTQPPLARIGQENNYDVYHNADGHTIQPLEDSFTETQTVMDLLRERHQAQSPGWYPTVSFEEFISGLLQWNEKTLTSPSGRHLGLYGALVTDFCNSSGEFSEYSDEEELNTKEMAAQILEMIHGLASSAARYGFYLQRWIQVINIMIYKKPGCIELDKLRVIHLFEADFNLMIGILFGR